MSSNTQTLRLRKPEQSKPTTVTPARHTGILQDQLRRWTNSQAHSGAYLTSPIRSAKRPWNPSFSLAVRILLMIRVAGAMYSNIQDCDEGTRSLYQLLYHFYLWDSDKSLIFGSLYITSIVDMGSRLGRSRRCMPFGAGRILFCTSCLPGYPLLSSVLIKYVSNSLVHSATDRILYTETCFFCC